jgi:hypothetical protein
MKDDGKPEGESVTLNPGLRFYILVFVAAVAIIVLRRPDAILNPQFWAEDGARFYADAYNKGLITLISPQGGYLDTFPRLVAAFTQLFPLSWAPLIFNISAIITKILPVVFLVSSRFSALIPDLRIRVFFAFLYFNLPNSWEVNASLVSTKNHLALLSFMVLSAKPNGHPLWRLFDAGAILLSGLSGPYCIALIPISAFFCFLRRDRRSFELFMLLGVCTLIQGFSLIGRTSSQLTLGATPELFIRILSTQVFLGSLIGQKGLSLIYNTGFCNLIVIVFAILGVSTPC